MSLLDRKYKKLKPTEKYLTDKVVLAQAWKKAHQYIRSTNWYADTFELDRSAIDLDGLLDQWIIELHNEGFEFNSLRLVPAPKSTQWLFEKINILDLNTEVPIGELGNNHRWVPKEEKALRPLAHVSIRDQTLMMALMMCVANQFEAAQGSTSTELEKVHKKGVVNYGNRLFCQFDKEGKAEFTWGNSTSYSKYFTDYQLFLYRPAYFGTKALNQVTKNETVYEIHLDIEKFYDHINREKLTKYLWGHVDNEEDALLNRILTAFDNWKWEEGSSDLYDAVCKSNDSGIPKGIPQGLVAGGFLANLYLLNLDQELNGLIETELTESIQLVDYCRYVDDMRLILVVKNGHDSQGISKVIDNIFGKKLSELGLSLNRDKTIIEKFKYKAGVGISQKLRDIQSKVSGPLSINEIDEQLGHLEGLIGLADSLRKSKIDKNNTNPLALIDGLNNDVREDTILRFSANKICTLLKQKRSLYAQEVDENGSAKSGSWDFLQERMARKFIACWSEDPSLVLMLKKGLELFPDKRVLSPVLQQLNLVSKRASENQKRVAEYCLGEIFRHSSTEIHTKKFWAFPAHADREGFFELLVNRAVEIIADENINNRNILEQARFLCLVRNESPLDKETSNQSFNTITKLIKGYRRISAEIKVPELVADTLLAYQLANDKSQVVLSVNQLIHKATANLKKKKGVLNYADVGNFLKKIAVESPQFFEELALYAKRNKLKWFYDHRLLVDKTGILDKPISGDLMRFKKPISLLGLIKRDDNPFAHENAVLALVIAILNGNEFNPEEDTQGLTLSAFDKVIDIANCKIECKNWNRVQSLDIGISVSIRYIDDDYIYPVPSWVNENHRQLYHLGIFVRSCLLGCLDWTSMKGSIVNSSCYTGIKTSLIKRQLGMMHSPESINGETAPMSGWLSSLIFHLLQWPGASLNSGGYQWPKEWAIERIDALIRKRIKFQRSIYCKKSGVPAYIEKVALNWEDDKKDLRVVMVQSLLPLKTDFNEFGFLLDTPIYRARHRRHVASIAELILHKAYSHNSIDDGNYKRVNIDLIVWPELAVNDDDIDILKKLADKTGAIIYTGIVFKNQPGIKGPNNLSKWIIPNKYSTGRQFITRLQGKQHLMADEIKHAKSWRPYQLLIELVHPAFPNDTGFILTGSICYDATDINMSADLKGISNAYLIPSLNRDVSTFDSMVDALYYHMYQHVVLVNTGEFGGSVAKAPYKEKHNKLISHVHGNNQVSISMFEMNMFDFRPIGKSYRSGKNVKTKPAGYDLSE